MTIIIEQIENKFASIGVARSNVARCLGITPSCYWDYRKGTRPVPRYIECSMEAHLKLTDFELELFCDERNPNADP